MGNLIPEHVGIIMDGNGRWAKKRGLPRQIGHTYGARTFRSIVRYISQQGVKVLTMYAFSTENWKRPPEEVNAIMKIFRQYLIELLTDFSTGITPVIRSIEEGALMSLSLADGALQCDYTITKAWATAAAEYVFTQPTDMHLTPMLTFRLKGNGSDTDLRIVCKNMSGGHEDWWYTESINLSQNTWKDIQLDLFYDYRTNVPLYPAFQAFFRERKPPTLIVWGKNDKIFPEPGAHPYKRDLPDAEMHILDTGHFALEDKLDEMAPLIRDFLDRKVAAR